MAGDHSSALLPRLYQETIDRLSVQLPALLRGNLYSLILYGSSVRGNLVDDVSDLNILIILNQSTPDAHGVIAEAIRGKVRIEPFVIGRDGMERSFEAFAIKFRSISRNYRVLSGTDPFTSLTVNPNTLRFLCEQAIRNLRLRTVYAFVQHGREQERYQEFLLHMTSQIIIDLAEVLRLSDIEIPIDFADRIAGIEHSFHVEAPVLRELLRFKDKPRRLRPNEIIQFHRGLFNLLDHVVRWMETKWPTIT